MKMPEIPEPAAHLADGLPVFSESQMVRFAKQYGRDLLEEAAKECEKEPAGLWSADALGNPCDMYVPRWRIVAAIRKLKETL